jgi:hypothetical protein
VTTANESSSTQASPSLERVYIFASLAAILVMGLVWAHPGAIIAQGDRSPILDPLNEAAKCNTAWTDHLAYVGQADASFGFVPYFLIYALFMAVFGASYGQVLVAALCLAVSWLGAFRCCRALGISAPMSCIAAWAYTLNPSRQNYLLILPSFDIMAAVIPWLFYLMLIAAQDQRRARASTLWIALIATLVGALLATVPQLILEIVLGCAAWAFLAARFAANQREYAGWVARTFAVAAIVSLWWAVPGAVAFKSGDITRVVTLAENGWIFERASLLNELRFVPSWSWIYPDYYPWASVSDRVAPLYISTFLLAAGLIAALVLARGRELFVVRFCGALALVMLFLSKGPHPPFEFINYWFFKIPGMFLFLETVGAITVAAMCLAICLGIALDAAPRHLQRVAVKPVLAALSIAAIVLGNIVIITGAVFHEPSGFEPAMHVKVPNYWLALAARVNSAPPGGVFVLPADPSYSVDYTWGFYGADNLPRDLLRREVFTPGAPLGYVLPHAQISIERKLTGMLDARSSLTAAVLRDLGIRYVLFRSDVREGAGYAFSARQAEALFESYRHERFGALDLYDLGPPAGRMTLARAVIANDTAGSGPGDQVELRGLEERVPRTNQAAFGALADLVALTETQAPRAGARLVWRGSLGPVAGAVADNATGHQLRAAYAVDRTPNSTLTLRYDQLRLIAADDAVPIPRVVGRVLGERGNLELEVTDPSARIVHCDVRIGVRPRRPVIYTLYVNSRVTGQKRVAAGETPVWVSFPQVRLLPGVNRLGLAPASYRFASFSPLLAPRAFTGGAFEPTEGQVEFNRIFAETRPAPNIVARAMRPLGVFTNINLQGGATLLLEAAPGSPGRASSWVIGVSFLGARYQCAEHVNDAFPVDLSETARLCFEGIGRELDAGDASHVTITSLWLVTGAGGEQSNVAPFATLSLSSRIEQPVHVSVSAAAGAVRFVLPAKGSRAIVRALPGGVARVAIASTASDISNMGIGAAPMLQAAETDVPISAHFGGFYAAHVAADGPHVVMVRDVYHPTWFAISLLPGFRILPHFAVDGWRNGWYARGPGLFIALNGLVLFQIICGALALSMLAWLWRAGR